MNRKIFNNMNIETLMPSNIHNYNNTKKIDVYTISSGKKINIDPDRDFNSDELLKNIYERRKKI